MKAKLANPVYSPVVASQGKQTVKEYLKEWVENHGKANLRPSTFAGYKSHIRNHIVPYIGHVQLNQLTPAMLDNMFQQLFDKDKLLDLDIKMRKAHIERVNGTRPEVPIH